MTTEQPRTTASADSNGRLTPDGLRRGVSRWWYIIFLGALTVFIPCGVTQAMMAAALGTGSLAMGAALMFAFTLGTSPVFFVVAYLTTELGSRLDAYRVQRRALDEFEIEGVPKAVMSPRGADREASHV